MSKKLKYKYDFFQSLGALVKTTLWPDPIGAGNVLFCAGRPCWWLLLVSTFSASGLWPSW